MFKNFNQQQIDKSLMCVVVRFWHKGAVFFCQRSEIINPCSSDGISK